MSNNGGEIKTEQVDFQEPQQMQQDLSSQMTFDFPEENSANQDQLESAPMNKVKVRKNYK